MIYQIITQGGIGDMITYQARLGSLLKPDDIVRFCIMGGFPKSIELQQQILLADPRVLQVEIGYLREADRTLDWRPDTFPLGYPIQIPFETPCTEKAKATADQIFEDNKIDPERVVVIQPRTTEGNQRGFEPERHWSLERWQVLVDLLHDSGLSVLQIGSSNDFYEAYLRNALAFTGLTSILESIALILKTKYFVGINSWCWEVAAYAGHPTVCIYLHNHFWIPLHVPSEGLENLTIFEDDAVQPETVFQELMRLGKETE